MIRSLVTAVAVTLALASSVMAGTTQTRETEALKKADRALAQREKAVARECAVNVGSPSKNAQAAFGQCTGPETAKRAAVQHQRDQVQGLLDQLEAGRPVDPAAVDRVLRDAGQSY